VFTRYRALTRRRWVTVVAPVAAAAALSAIPLAASQAATPAMAASAVIACFMDTQDGREHTTLGMEKVIQILK
jgi:hypothetical protein